MIHRAPTGGQRTARFVLATVALLLIPAACARTAIPRVSDRPTVILISIDGFLGLEPALNDGSLDSVRVMLRH